MADLLAEKAAESRIFDSQSKKVGNASARSSLKGIKPKGLQANEGDRPPATEAEECLTLQAKSGIRKQIKKAPKSPANHLSGQALAAL